MQTILVDFGRGSRRFYDEVRGQHRHFGDRGGRRGKGAVRFGRGRPGRVKPEADFVCVHDAARPCLTDAWIDEIFAAAEKTGAAIFAVPIFGTLKLVGARSQDRGDRLARTVWEAQTPQVFRRRLLLDAYAKRAGFAATDDAQLVERIGHPVTVVPGSPINLKITTKEDQRLAEFALKALPKPKLTGPINPFADDDKWR